MQEITSAPKPYLGQRVAVIRNFDDDFVFLYGFGVHLGNCLVDGDDVAMCPQLEGEDFAQRVVLDDDTVVYGPEGYWRPMTEFGGWAENRKVIPVDIWEDRKTAQEPVCEGCPLNINVNVTVN
jgi:hypothetical protein